MEKSISPIAFCGTLPLYAHKIVEFSEAFEEDSDLLLDRFLGVLAVFGVFTAVIIYGGIMNPAAAMMTSSESLKWEALIACYITGLPMDLVHGFGTLIFLMIAAEPMLEKMDRIKVKYGIAD
jgi:energy-coupling factor transport system ATP-binding protein